MDGRVGEGDRRCERPPAAELPRQGRLPRAGGQRHGRSRGRREPKERITVEDAPKLYRLVHTPNQQTATLLLSVSDGVEAYDFTFG
jgi:hypothetical protein